MQEQNNHILSAEKFISKKDAIEYDHFLEELDYMDASIPSYYIIAVDSIFLGAAIVEDVNAKLSNAQIDKSVLSDGSNLMNLFLSYKSDEPVIIPLFNDTKQDNSKIAAQLIFNRDEIVRQRLDIIFVLSKPLYDIALREAFDFVNAANGVFDFEDIKIQKKGDENDIYNEFLKQKKEIEKLEKKKRIKINAKIQNYYDFAFFANNNVSQYDISLEYYKKALLLARKNKTKYNISIIYSDMATVYYNKGMIGKSFSSIQKALEIQKTTGDFYGRISSLIGLGRISKVRSEYEKAIRYFQRSYKKSVEVGDRVGEIMSLEYLGQIFIRGEGIRRELEYSNKALEIYKILGRKDYSIPLSMKGYYYMEKGDFNKSLEYIENALEIEEKSGNPNGKANRYLEIHNNYILKGNLEHSLDYLNIALDIYVSVGDKVNEFAAFYSLGNYYMEKGELKKAFSLYEKVISFAEKENYNALFNNCRTSIGRYYMILKKYKKAEIEINKSLEESNVFGKEPSYNFNLLNKGVLLRETKEYQKSQKCIKEVKEFYHNTGYILRYNDTLIELAKLNLTQQNHQEARQNFQEAYDFFNPRGILKGKSQALQGLGEVEFQKGNKQEALKYLYEAKEIYKKVGYKLLLEEINEIIPKVELETPSLNTVQEDPPEYPIN